jgi:glycosyltransferase involved in cell wall biosynthesis
MTVRVLFLDPFFDGSHRTFGEGLREHSAHEVTLLTLPGGEWRRRMRLGAQELARRVAELEGRFDALVATDMLDLPAFLALTRPRFERTPVMAYFHENQLTYPRLRGTKLNSWFGGINYLSALAADVAAFNSAFHRDDFLAALRTLVAGPHNWLDGVGIAAIERKAEVLPVGVDLSWPGDGDRRPRGGRAGPPLVLWNHRWEFDKAPDVFARALLRLAAEGLAFDVALAGEPGPNPHPAMAELREALGQRVRRFGMAASVEEYRDLLLAADVAVSTARHEFFGIGTVEALAAGCIPVAPARYNYPALVPEPLHGELLWNDEEDLARKLRGAIVLSAGGSPRLDAMRRALRESALRFAWERVAPAWDQALATLAARHR